MFSQLLSMAVLIGIGWYLGHTKKISDTTTKELSNILMRFVVPMVMILTLDRPFVRDEAVLMLAASVITIVGKVLSIAVANVFFKRSEIVEKYGVIFYNSVFMGIPLIQGLFGIESLIYIVPTVVISNIFTWTYGRRMMSGSDEKLGWKGIATNPSIIGAVVGLLFFLTPLTLPGFLRNAMEWFGNINTPLGMLLIGVFLASEPITLLFRNRMGLKVSVLRLLVVPVILALMLLPLPVSAELKVVQVIINATPVAVHAAVFSQLMGRDANYAAQIVCLSTLLMLVTMPLIQYFAQMLYGM